MVCLETIFLRFLFPTQSKVSDFPYAVSRREYFYICREYLICLSPKLFHADGDTSSLMEARNTQVTPGTKPLGNIQTDDDDDLVLQR